MRSPASRLSARVSAIAESATLQVDARAKAMRAQGRSVIGFGAGEPDFPTPAHIVAAAQEACADPRNHRYTPAAGLPELRQAIVDVTKRDAGRDIALDQVVVTNGGKQAIYETFSALLDPGDEVLVPAPYWTTYPESIRLAGGSPVIVAPDESTARVDVDLLEAACSPRTTTVVLVSPSNPSGAVHSADELRSIGSWAAERGLWVVTDEIYEHLVYDDLPTGSLPALCPELADRTVVVNGVAKTYAMTGWRVGWLIAPPDVAAGIANLQSHATSNVANVSQRAALAALEGGLGVVREMRGAFDRRRHRIVRMLNEIEGIDCPRPGGAFYVFPSVEGLLASRAAGPAVATSLDLAEFLLVQAEVAVVPGEAFGSPGHLRFSYALADDDLVEGIARIQRLLG